MKKQVISFAIFLTLGTIFTLTSCKKDEEETTTVTATGVPTTTTVSQGGSSSGINVGANSGLRLGFVF